MGKREWLLSIATRCKHYIIKLTIAATTMTSLTDKQQIDNIIGQFFSIFNNKPGTTHNWELIYAICLPETAIIKKNGLDQTAYNLASFMEPRITILTDGRLRDFEEHETGEQTIIIQNIAQRHSRYRKSGIMAGKYFQETGTKLFHLLKTKEGWKISTLLWEDDIP